MVPRVGRIRGDGSRTSATPTIRITVYLPLDLARALDLAATGERTKSGVIADALARLLAGSHDPNEGADMRSEGHIHQPGPDGIGGPRCPACLERAS